MGKKKLDSEFNVMPNNEMSQCNDLQTALDLINKENIITETEPIEQRKFIVAKNENLTSLKKASFEEKNEVELDEIANQADQAFYDLMDIAINTTGKAVGDISSSAHNFLTIKLNARLAKIDAKYKKLNHDLQLQKLEMASKKKSSDDEDDDEDDDIVIIEKED